MLDIPTAKAKAQPVQARRAAPSTTGSVTDSLTAEPADASMGGGATLAAQPTAVTPQPYEYAGQGWNDPVAQSVMKDYFSGPQWNTGSAPGMYEQNMNIAQAYNDNPGVLHSPLDPASWGTTFRGQEYADIADK